MNPCHDQDYCRIEAATILLKNKDFYTDIETREKPSLGHSYGVYKFLGPTPSFSYALPLKLLPTLVKDFKTKIEV